jgi:hypothetical protein
MNRKHKFRAVIKDAGDGGAYVTIPFDVEQVFGKKRVKVKAVFEGEPYRGSLVRMGEKKHILGVRKDIRQKLGKAIGDEIEIELAEDTLPRVVSVPHDLRQALDADQHADEVFKQLSYTHQKEYVEWIQEAKREQTRQRRIVKTIEMLKSGRKQR